MCSMKCRLVFTIVNFITLCNLFVVYGCHPNDPDGTPWKQQTASNGGRQGANRVIYSPIGVPCGGVVVAFSEPIFNIGDPRNLDSPNPYVGFQVPGVQIDAGVKWEAGKGQPWIDRNGQSHPGTEGWWTVFMYISSHGCRAERSLRPATRIPAQELGDFILTLSMHDKDGLVDLEIDYGTQQVPGQQAFIRNAIPYWDRGKSNNHINISQVGARRVIAMTQGKGVTYDGAWLKCAVTAGGVAVIKGQTSDGSPILDWNDWTGPDKKNAKDYNPEGAAHENDMRNYEGKQWAVDFGLPFKRNSDGSHPKLPSSQENQRYQHETVYIRLLKPIAQVDRKNPPRPRSGH